jgi:hypothetical protein
VGENYGDVVRAAVGKRKVNEILASTLCRFFFAHYPSDCCIVDQFRQSIRAKQQLIAAVQLETLHLGIHLFSERADGGR